MSAVLNMDRAGELHWVFRKGRAETRTLTFMSGEDPFPLAGYDFELRFRPYNGSTDSLVLSIGDGLTIDDNTLEVEVTDEDTDQPEILHSADLFEVTTGRSWAIGTGQFITGLPHTSEDTEVQIVVNSVTVNISSLNSINGGTP
jgi:hypothetical protein